MIALQANSFLACCQWSMDLSAKTCKNTNWVSPPPPTPTAAYQLMWKQWSPRQCISWSTYVSAAVRHGNESTLSPHPPHWPRPSSSYENNVPPPQDVAWSTTFRVVRHSTRGYPQLATGYPLPPPPLPVCSAYLQKIQRLYYYHSSDTPERGGLQKRLKLSQGAAGVWGGEGFTSSPQNVRRSYISLKTRSDDRGTC